MTRRVAVVAAVGAALVTAAGTAAYYRYLVIGKLEARLGGAAETRRELERVNALLSKQVDAERRANRQATEAAADRLDQDRSAVLDAVDGARADLRACRDAREQVERAAAGLGGELDAARGEIALLRQRLSNADATGRLLDTVRELEDQRTALAEERGRLMASVSALGPELAETDRQCVIGGPESPACADASRLHREESALKGEASFLRDRIERLDAEIARYQEQVR